MRHCCDLVASDVGTGFFFKGKQEDEMVEEAKMLGPLISFEDKMVAFSSPLDGGHLNQSTGCYMRREELQQ